MIRSSSNPQVQKAKTIYKSRKTNLFLVEGKKLIQEATASHFRILDVFVTSDVWRRERSWLEGLEKNGCEIAVITPSLMKSISDVESPQGMLAIAKKSDLRTDLLIARIAMLLISVRNPGNLGAMLRVAEATGCEWIGYSTDCADPFQPKVVRASMGSLFRLPLIEIKDPIDFIRNDLPRNVSSYGLFPRAQKSLFDCNPSFPVLICIGSETHGLPADLPVTEKIFIPMKGNLESLNAAVAAGVCLYTLTFLKKSAE